ncbi:LppM family (lipo)protein [Micromonospora sp. NPDC092111]|uniref:LppM family (lipo)protein n=1 Tax=Micromonospora sp. NPDC092111 TaxID=3364289 RepID=UPI0038148F1D
MNTGLMRGRALRVAVCLALVTLLAGCMQLNLGLTVNADDTIDGQLLLTAEKSLLSSRNTNVAAAFAELRENIPTLPPGEETSYEDARYYGAQITYHHTPLKDFTSESVNLVRDGDLYRFSLPLDPEKYGGKVAQQNPQNQQYFMRLMSFEISVTFPGRVIDTNGTVSGRSVTWKVVANQAKPTELRAIAEAPPKPTSPATSAAAAGSDQGSFPWLLVAGAVLVLLLAGVVVAVLVRRRGRTAGPPAAPGGPPGGTGPTPPADHPGPA